MEPTYQPNKTSCRTTSHTSQHTLGHRSHQQRRRQRHRLHSQHLEALQGHNEVPGFPATGTPLLAAQLAALASLFKLLKTRSRHGAS